MTTSQPGILANLPAHARYLEFSAFPDSNIEQALRNLAETPIDESLVIGFGPGLVQGLESTVPGLHAFPALSGPGIEVPSTQADIWIWVRGNDRGNILHASRAITAHLESAFECVRLTDGFMFDGGRDLTGYEDGTENPKGDDAVHSAIVGADAHCPTGSSFVSVQQWLHDLDHFQSLPETTQDDIIGRRRTTNEEFDDSPASAHVKRTAQESFDPEAFVLRRSMPWADANGEGLVFVSFCASLDSFEAQLRRMTGMDDGIVDALFRFTRPLSGSHFWCPPVSNGRLDLSSLGL